MKKGIAVDTLIKLIIFVLVLVVGVYIIYMNVFSSMSTESNKDAIFAWVTARGAVKGMVGDSQPPVTQLADPIKIESRNDLLWQGGNPPKLYKDMANTMVDCWAAFDRGHTDFMNNRARTTFCFPCRAIMFSDEIKREGTQMTGFNRYLNETKTRSTGTETYIQYLANDKNFVLELEDLQNDTMIADKNLYIYFFAASGRGMVNIITNVLGFGDMVPEDTGSTRTFNPTDGSQPQATFNGLSGSEKEEIAFATSGASAAGTIYGKYRLAKLGTEMGSEIARTTVTSTAETLALERTTIELAKDGSAKILMQTAKSTASKVVVEKAAEKAAAGIMKKGLAKLGARVLGPIGWGITIASAGYGIYNVVWGEKPYIAKIMLVEPEKVNSLCNQ